MSKTGWLLAGAGLLLLGEAVLAGITLSRARGWSAREAPGSIERWLASAARSAALPADAKSRTNPVADSEEVYVAARAHWADHCASCHANDGSGEAPMGKQMYPPAPDMRERATQDLTDGELFFIIENGIRLTGMPAWGGPDHDAGDSWKLVHFIRRLPRLTPEDRRIMEKLNPKGPDDRKEEEEEEKFLKGEDTVETQPQHHH